MLGTSVDDHSIYPRENQNLARKIVDTGGTLLSEFPPPTPAKKHHFPMRNRIIAGIAKVVIVVEANEKSGALITARFGNNEGRDIYAVPGSIFNPLSMGSNYLISSGAYPFTKIEDFINTYFKSTYISYITGFANALKHDHM